MILRRLAALVFVASLMLTLFASPSSSSKPIDKLSVLVRQMKDKRAWLRADAAYRLGKCRNRQATDALIRALKDPNPDVRDAAAKSLGEIGDKRAVEPLIAALYDDYEEVREAIVEALGQLRDKRAAGELLSMLADDNSIDQALTEALKRIADPRTIDGLIALLGDETERQREAVDVIAAIGRPSVPALLKVVDSESATVRRGVADALGRIGDRSAVPAEIKLLNDSDAYVRESAARALGELRDGRAIEVLVAAIENESAEPATRNAAAESLGRLGGPHVVEALTPLIVDERSPIRAGAAAGLVYARDSGSARLLIRLLAKSEPSQDWEFVRAAYMAIRTVAPAPWIEALTDSDPAIRKGAATALGAMYTNDPRVVGALIQATGDQDSAVRSSAARALHSRSPLAIQPLITALKDASAEVREAAALSLGCYQLDSTFSLNRKVLEHLLFASKDPDPRVRGAIAKALCQSGDSRAVPLFIAVLGDTSCLIRDRYTAAEGLGRAHDSRGAPALVAALTDRDLDLRRIAARALGWRGNTEGIAPLLALPENADPRLRGYALESLGSIGDLRAVPAITRGLRSDNQDVARSASTALLAICDSADSRHRAAAIRALRPALADPKLHDQVLFTLAGLGDRMTIEPLIALLHKPRPSLPATDIPSGPPPVLLADAGSPAGPMPSPRSPAAALGMPMLQERTQAISLLGGFKDKRAVRALVGIAKHGDEFERIEAAESLARIDGKAAVGFLIAALEDEDYFTRLRAAQSSSEIRDPRVESALMSALRDWRLEIVGGAGDFYIRRGVVEAIPAMVDALHEIDKHDSMLDDLAVSFMRSGRPDLIKVAREWTEEQGILCYEHVPGKRYYKWGEDARRAPARAKSPRPAAHR